MENIKIDLGPDGIATITIDLNYRGERSKSGKTIRVASTEGNKKIEGAEDVILGLNAYTK